MKNPITWLKARSLKQKLIIIAIVAVLAFIGNKQINAKDDSLTYQYATIEKGDITQVVSETGEVTTSNKIEIPSSITGVVQELYVDNGQSVTRGQDLFYVTSTATDAERSKAWSDYLSAQATLEQAQASQYSLQAKMFTQWDEFKELAESDGYEEEDGTPKTDQRNLPEFQTPEKEWLAAEADYTAQDQVIAKAQASLNNAWLNYQATIDGSVKATADGIVQNISVAHGQSVKASEDALIIETSSQVWVQVAINENDIITVAPNQQAEVSVDALSGKTLPATVQRVDQFGTEISDVMVYYVYLTLDETDELIRPGMTSQVDIITQQKKDIVLVPNTAIKPYQGSKAVQIMDQETSSVIYQPITVGISGDTYTEVILGLNEGDKIITSSTNTEEKSGGGLFSRPK